MRYIVLLSIILGVFVIPTIGVSSIQAADQKPTQVQDHWRYTFHNGEWWYWLPSNKWVYWRANQWNAYEPRTYASPSLSSAAVTGLSGSSYGRSRADDNSDIRPYYGHAESTLDRHRLEPNSEVGPFYGHALPSEVFGGGPARRSIRPFYGRAASSDGD
jgi:hypothetical protein